jgi:hypothetical protein
MDESITPRKLQALERIEISRAALHHWVDEAEGSEEGEAGSSPSGSSWLSTLTDLPMVGPLLATVRAAWADSPWPFLGTLAVRQAKSAVFPVIRKHPFASLLMAGLAGYAITRHRNLVIGFAAGKLINKLVPAAQSMLHSLVGVATTNVLDQWLQASKTSHEGQAQAQSPS